MFPSSESTQKSKAFVVDPMYICRNAILPNWNLDMRQVVYWVFGPYGALGERCVDGATKNYFHEFISYNDICI